MSIGSSDPSVELFDGTRRDGKSKVQDTLDTL